MTNNNFSAKTRKMNKTESSNSYAVARPRPFQSATPNNQLEMAHSDYNKYADKTIHDDMSQEVRTLLLGLFDDENVEKLMETFSKICNKGFGLVNETNFPPDVYLLLCSFLDQVELLSDRSSMQPSYESFRPYGVKEIIKIINKPYPKIAFVLGVRYINRGLKVFKYENDQIMKGLVDFDSKYVSPDSFAHKLLIILIESNKRFHSESSRLSHFTDFSPPQIDDLHLNRVFNSDDLLKMKWGLYTESGDLEVPYRKIIDLEQYKQLKKLHEEITASQKEEITASQKSKANRYKNIFKQKTWYTGLV